MPRGFEERPCRAGNVELRVAFACDGKFTGRGGTRGGGDGPGELQMPAARWAVALQPGVVHREEFVAGDDSARVGIHQIEGAVRWRVEDLKASEDWTRPEERGDRIPGAGRHDEGPYIEEPVLRGIALVHVPTTLLAQVDSAIGGKVGVNHPLGKNLIGAFYQPHAVIVDPGVLGTLPRREFRAGLYEVIKYGMTSSPSLFERVARDQKAIFGRAPDALTAVIAESCKIKADVVAADEKESGLRRILNFGHTAGHALESVTRYRRFRHGEAVGYGMLVAAELAVSRGALAETDRKALADLIASLGPLPPIGDISVSSVLEAMQHDKKMIAGRLHFVLPTAIGATAIVDDVTEKEMKKALARLGLKK